jgi:hypothetical protein
MENKEQAPGLPGNCASIDSSSLQKAPRSGISSRDYTENPQ